MSKKREAHEAMKELEKQARATAIILEWEEDRIPIGSLMSGMTKATSEAMVALTDYDEDRDSREI